MKIDKNAIIRRFDNLSYKLHREERIDPKDLEPIERLNARINSEGVKQSELNRAWNLVLTVEETNKVDLVEVFEEDIKGTHYYGYPQSFWRWYCSIIDEN